jgi:hypothetical protein
MSAAPGYEWYLPSNAYNIVRDYNVNQGFTHASDNHVQTVRDINTRHIRVDNSALRPVGIALATYYCQGPVPKKQYTMGPGESKDLSINSFGGPMQYLYLLDPVTGELVGQPTAVNTRSNAFVIRDSAMGNVFWTQFFHYPEYRAAH